jgi:hypothetical protein
MHFFYIDESGCTGRDLNPGQQPIFVLGGIILRDEGWNITHTEYVKIINDYFDGVVPENFELHTQDLFSPNGSGHFENHPREDRNELLNTLLDLIAARKHHFYYYAVDKARLNVYNTALVRERDYLDLRTPYLTAYDYLVTAYEEYTKVKLGNSARALVIIDEKDIFIDEVERITRYRRFEGAAGKRIKWIVEFSYPVNSRKNTMIQLSDMMLFLTRKYLEIESGYRNTYPSEVKNIFRDFYRKIDDRLIFKRLQTETGRHSEYYNTFIENVASVPSARWRTKVYE